MFLLSQYTCSRMNTTLPATDISSYKAAKPTRLMLKKTTSHLREEEEEEEEEENTEKNSPLFFCPSFFATGPRSVRLSACPHVRLSVRLSACPPVRVSACPSVRLSVCPPVRL